jgi:formylglycine-generating enzyme required for sulfatase activity
MNVEYSSSNPSKGGGIYIVSGEAVNCIIAFNLDDNGAGIDGDGGDVVNCTVARNGNAPGMVFIKGSDGSDGSGAAWQGMGANSQGVNGPFKKVGDFYIGSTECTQTQYACFLSAIDWELPSANAVSISIADRDSLVVSKTPSPVAEYRNLSIETYYGLVMSASPDNGQWKLVGVNGGATDWTVGADPITYLSTSPSSATIKSQVIYPAFRSTPSYETGSSGSVSWPVDPQKRDNFPIGHLTWYGSMVYSAWLGGVLPTEAEWEYAGRKHDTGIIMSGYNDSAAPTSTAAANQDNVAWYNGGGIGSGNRIREVATKTATSLGLYDMLGNQWEWVADWANVVGYGDGMVYLANAAPTVCGVPVGNAYMVSGNDGGDGSSASAYLLNAMLNRKVTGSRLIRSGGWNFDASNERFGYRYGYHAPAYAHGGVGFRPLVCP